MLYNGFSLKMGGVAMHCMKCGRDLEPGQVFCEECQAEMKKYPVKPGTVVQLPRRREEAPNKKAAGGTDQSSAPQSAVAVRAGADPVGPDRFFGLSLGQRPAGGGSDSAGTELLLSR